MAERSVHGNQRNSPGPSVVLETLPYPELPEGTPVQADEISRAAAEERGRFAPANKRSALGGRARKGKPRMTERVALTPPGESLPTHRYHVASKAFARAAGRTIAATVGGGQLDPHTGYLVMAAARAAKWANYYSDLAERLGEGSREQVALVAASLSADEKASSHLRNAHEYAARMAKARPAAPPSWLTETTEPTEPETADAKPGTEERTHGDQ